MFGVIVDVCLLFALSQPDKACLGNLYIVVLLFKILFVKSKQKLRCRGLLKKVCYVESLFEQKQRRRRCIFIVFLLTWVGCSLHTYLFCLCPALLINFSLLFVPIEIWCYYFRRCEDGCYWRRRSGVRILGWSYRTQCCQWLRRFSVTVLPWRCVSRYTLLCSTAGIMRIWFFLIIFNVGWEKSRCKQIAAQNFFL